MEAVDTVSNSSPLPIFPVVATVSDTTNESIPDSELISATESVSAKPIPELIPMTETAPEKSPFISELIPTKLTTSELIPAKEIPEKENFPTPQCLQPGCNLLDPI